MRLLLLLIILTGFGLNAQVSVEQLDDKYTPPSESILGEGKDDDYYSDNLMPYKHTLTANTFMFFRNKALINYSYQLNDFIHVLVGVGAGWDQDNFRAQTSAFDDSYSTIINNSETVIFENATVFNVGFRFPFYGVWWDTANNYFQFDYRYSSDKFTATRQIGGDYNYDLGAYEPLGSITEPVSINEHQFSLLLGYHWETPLGRNLSLVHFAHYGLGYRTDSSQLASWDLSGSNHAIVGLLSYSIGIGHIK